METTTTINNQLEVFASGSIEIFRSAPEILKENKLRTEKALIVGNNILDKWHEAWNIENEEERLAALATIDERSNNYLVNCGKALKEEKEVRAAITQMMDEFKKMFTAAENDIDKTKPNTVPSKVQNNRDTYAAESAKIAERKRREAELAAAKATEVINIRTEAQKEFTSLYYKHIASRKQALIDTFNAITLDTFDKKKEGLMNLKFSYSTPPYQFNQYVKSHSKEEAAQIADEAAMELNIEFSSNYLAEMNLLKEELIDKLSSKKSELVEQKRLADEAAAEAERFRIAEQKRQEEISKANKAERERLEKEAAIEQKKEADRQAELKRQQDEIEAERTRREKEESIKLEQEAQNSQNLAEQKIDIKKQGEQTMVMFEQEATLAETNTPESRQGYEITVLHPVGYTQIFAAWFEKEGKSLPVDKIGNTKLDQMKAFCEKAAQKDGFFIESKFLKYEQSFKAVNKKTK